MLKLHDRVMFYSTAGGRTRAGKIVAFSADKTTAFIECQTQPITERLPIESLTPYTPEP
jgi:hypothetical protein